MRILMRITLLLVILTILIPVSNIYAGALSSAFFLNETDSNSWVVYTPFDLRDRESFVQVTNIDSAATIIHVQIYNVANLCNENDFFDVMTPNDTHVYNLRDILTNDGNPSGVILPENAYGIVFISAVPTGPVRFFDPIISNFRIIDNSGYEYRSNAQSFIAFRFETFLNNSPTTFNFSNADGITLSDVFGIPVSTNSNGFEFSIEANIDDVLSAFIGVDVDIVDNNEVLFSCRDVIFACIDENSPLLEELIGNANNFSMGGSTSASVARFEYGINDVIPHSKGGELLCPGNNIPEGLVSLNFEVAGAFTNTFAGYIGLNNGNGRGSMDSFLSPSVFIPNPDPTWLIYIIK